MGCCISKCIPNKKSHHDIPELEDHDDQVVQDQFSRNVQDKLVIISQSPNKGTQIPLVINPNKLIVSDPSRTPPSPSASTSSSSASSFVTRTTSKTSMGFSSSSSSSASSSSSLFGKDKSSFSNEFLWSCYKENPHISRINSLKETSKHYNNNKVISSVKPIVSTSKQTCPQKRVRPVSPSPNYNSSSTLTRQKSFRRDHHQPAEQCSTLRISSTPSPSRRFMSNIGEMRESDSNRVTASTKYSRKENLRPCFRSSSGSGSAREQRNVHRIRSKIDDIAVAKALACHEIENASTEDINNPLISMDCFIFI